MLSFKPSNIAQAILPRAGGKRVKHVKHNLIKKFDHECLEHA